MIFLFAPFWWYQFGSSSLRGYKRKWRDAPRGLYNLSFLKPTSPSRGDPCFTQTRLWFTRGGGPRASGGTEHNHPYPIMFHCHSQWWRRPGRQTGPVLPELSRIEVQVTLPCEANAKLILQQPPKRDLVTGLDNEGAHPYLLAFRWNSVPIWSLLGAHTISSPHHASGLCIEEEESRLKKGNLQNSVNGIL